MGGYDYTAVGHVTADVFADGSVRPGGSALYSALQAARLGRRALIITQGVEQPTARGVGVGQRLDGRERLGRHDEQRLRGVEVVSGLPDVGAVDVRHEAHRE